MLDTARNFIPIPDILEANLILEKKITFTIDLFLQLIDSLSYSKQNVFHWHLTDSQSFPLLMPSLPDFVRYGAYKPNQVYMPDQVQTCQSPQWPSCIVSSIISSPALQIYYQVKELVEYARERGVQVNKENQVTHDNRKICDDHRRYIDWKYRRMPGCSRA